MWRRPVTAVALVAVLGLVACAGPADEAPATPVTPERPVEFVGVAGDAAAGDAWVEASVRLASELLGLTEEGENAVVSPLSLQLALAMLREGASGRVAAEIDAAVGMSGADSQAVADVRAHLAQFEGDVAGIDKDNPPETPLVHIADSVFVQPGFPVEAQFLERVAAYHLAQVYEADFAGRNAKPLLDAWVQEETGGLLEEAPFEPDPDTRVVLMDAVTFGASWRMPFDPSATRDAAFHLTDGQTVQVPMMGALLPAGYAESDGWQAIELPYTEGFAMRIVVPPAGIPTRDQWEAAHAALDAAESQLVQLGMPRWETDTTVDLTRDLGDLGLGSLVEPGGGLDGVFPGAYVNGIAQGATITVAEQGTVAAAVTEIAVGESAAPLPEIELNLDRPFEYQVIDERTGLVLFAGRVLDPS